MRKLLAVAAFLGALLAAPRADAANSIMDVGYSTFSAKGITCSTGTVIQINASRPTGFTSNIAGYRIQNQDSADPVWIGDVNVSSSTVANLGEMLNGGSPGDSVVYPVGKDYASDSQLVKVYCIAANGAGAAGATISVIWFGY